METPKEESAENKRQFYRELFNEDLYVINEPEPMPIAQPEPTQATTESSKVKPEKQALAFSGNEASSLLILYSYPKGGHVPSGDEAMLRKLVAAVRQEYDNVLKLNMTEGVSLGEILAQSSASTIISFGVPSISSKYKMNEVVAMLNRKIIVSHSVAELEANVDLKKALWLKLQEVFKK